MHYKHKKIGVKVTTIPSNLDKKCTLMYIDEKGCMHIYKDIYDVTIQKDPLYSCSTKKKESVLYTLSFRRDE